MCSIKYIKYLEINLKKKDVLYFYGECCKFY